MNCLDIIMDHLDKNGFDGLVNTDISCGCSKKDMAPCESFSILDCEPAYERIADCKNCDSPCDGYEDGGDGECYTTKRPEGRVAPDRLDVESYLPDDCKKELDKDD